MINKDRIVLYHSGLAGDKFYVGERNKRNISVVNDKVDVTSDFLRCVTQWLPNSKTIITTDSGKKFEVICKELKTKRKNKQNKHLVGV